jgi:hypothetical protein
MKSTPTEWHFSFHNVLDLPEMLVAGRERLYLQYFYDRHAARPTAVDTDAYAEAYEQAGAMRAGFDLYRAFETDDRDIRDALADGGKLTIPCLGMYGEASVAHAEAAEEIGHELADDVTVEAIPGSGTGSPRRTRRPWSPACCASTDARAESADRTCWTDATDAHSIALVGPRMARLRPVDFLPRPPPRCWWSRASARVQRPSRQVRGRPRDPHPG